MDKPHLYSSLCERFPEWSEQIRQLAQQDPVFNEACSDYEELAKWLVVHEHDDCPPEPACAVNHLLLEELEIEILQALNTAERPS